MRQRRKRRTEVRVQLFIKGFRCHPDEVTQVLGISPTETWLKGEPIRKAGGALYRGNGWELKSPTAPTASPEEQLEALLPLIRPYTKNFRRLPPGSVVDLSCAIYAYDDSQRVFLFSTEAVKALAAIGAPISVAYYDFTNLPEEKSPRREPRKMRRRPE